MKFDIKSYLSSRDIPYKTSGENVTRGWIEITCVLPGCSDHKEHLGINLKSLIYKCWLCGRSGPASHLISIIDNCSQSQAQTIAKKFPRDDEDNIWENDKEEAKKDFVLPGEYTSTKNWPAIHLNYLISRGFDPDIIIPRFQLRSIHTVGDYRFRIIIPISINHQIVAFTSMDVLRQGDGRPPYQDCPINEAIVPVKQCLYNIDSVKDDKAIIYEGVTGVWRFGDGAVASFTSNLTPEQIILLKKKKIKQVFLLYDPDATQKGEKMAIQLSGVIPHVEQICFKNGDPKDLPPKSIIQLKKDLGFV